MTDHEVYIQAKKLCSIIQDEDEILWAMREIRDYFGEDKPKTFLELGCHGGGSLCMWSRVMADDGTLIGLSPVQDEEFFIGHIKSIIKKDVKLVNGLSEWPASLAIIEKILDGRKLDCLFIDTIHTEEQTRIEFEMYMPSVGSPGMIIFHDIILHRPVEGKPGTGYFWDNIKVKYNYVEKHNVAGGRRFGIGILLL